MTNVQGKDPARRAHRFTPIETKAGQPRDAWSIPQILHAALPAETFDGPRREGLQPFRGFKELIRFDSRRMP